MINKKRRAKRINTINKYEYAAILIYIIFGNGLANDVEENVIIEK